MTPQWFLRGSVYQINPRTFSAEGTLRAITRELPFLAELGFKIIYLCPIFKADDSLEGRSPRQLQSKTENPKNPYRMNGFFEIDGEYGTMEDLKALISQAHRLDLKVMLDLVYLHIGPNAEILREHPEYAERDAQGNAVLTEWNFPKLNFACEGLREYLWCNMVYYVGVLGADGFRCDVGYRIPLDFWMEGKRRIRAVKPDAVLLNEGSDWSYLEECFDASYAFHWHIALYDVLINRERAALLREVYEEVERSVPLGATLIRDMDNHDTVTDWPQRTEKAIGHAGMELVQVLNYAINGVPMVYCGNELGDTARLNMFANRFFKGCFEVTDRTCKSEPHSLRRQEVFRKLNALRRQSSALCFGKTEWLAATDRVIAFSRRTENEETLFIGNLSGQRENIGISLGECEVLLSGESVPHIAENEISLGAYEYALLRKKPSGEGCLQKVTNQK